MADVIGNIQSLIDEANRTTGKADTDMTGAVQSLIGGFGVGSGGPGLISETVYTQAEDWLSAEKGNGENLGRVYCNTEDVTDRALYLAEVTGNQAPKFCVFAFTAQRVGSGTYLSKNIRGASWRRVDDPSDAMGLYGGVGLFISKGAQIRVLKFSTDGTAVAREMVESGYYFHNHMPCISVGERFEQENTEEQYNALVQRIRDFHLSAPAGQYYQLQIDGTWQLRELPPTPVLEEEPSALKEKAEAYDILTGGEQ